MVCHPGGDSRTNAHPQLGWWSIMDRCVDPGQNGQITPQRTQKGAAASPSAEAWARLAGVGRAL